MNALEDQADNAKARQLFWKPMSWLGTIRPTTANERLGIGVQCFPPSSPFAKCGCKKHALDLYGDHTSTCTAHSGATKAHDWMVSVLGPLFRTAGHVVRTQRGVTASAGQRRGDVEIRGDPLPQGPKPGAGAWSLTSALQMMMIKPCAAKRFALMMSSALTPAGHQKKGKKKECLPVTAGHLRRIS